MDYRLELVPIPVSDVHRAKAFYAEKVGFTVDHDVNANTDPRVSNDMRVVQLTPPGSACSIAFGIGILDTQPGSVQALHLVVSDMEAAREELAKRGVEVGEVQNLGGHCTLTSAILTATAGPCSSCPISRWTLVLRSSLRVGAMSRAQV